MNPRMPGLELWFVTGSQHLYGPEVLDLVAEHARAIASGLDGQSAIPVRVVAQAGGQHGRGHRGAAARGRRHAGLRRGDRVDAHLLAGQDVDRRASAHLRKPLVHLHTQFNRDLPWSSIDMDFMNLNQSAHGDREFAFIQTRLRRNRKTVVGHWQDPAVAAKARVVGARRGRLARGAPAADRALRRQHARRRRHRGRQGRGAGAARVLGQRLRGERPRRGGRRRARGRRRPAHRRVRGRYDVVPDLRPGGRAPRRPARRGADRGGPAVVPRGRVASARSPTRSRTSARSSSCPGSASSG